MQCTTPGGEAWVPDDTTFAARLVLIRQRMGWNARTAANACGIPPVTWLNWEQGRKPRNYIAACQAIARATGCSVSWLAGIDAQADPARAAS